MRIIYESISAGEGAFITSRDFDLKQFDCPYHMHPELEIVRIDASEGRILAGDFAGSFKPDEIYLFGSRLPHAFINREGTTTAKSRCIQLNVDALRGMIDQFPEAKKIDSFLNWTNRGLKVSPEHASTISVRMDSIFSATGLSRLVKVLELLNHLIEMGELIPLSSEGYVPKRASRQVDRMESVLTHIHENSSSEIQMDDLAKVAAMSPTAFHRFFKQSLGCTPGAYLADLRLSNVAHRLLESADSIAEIAFASGFNNLSNFNRQFRRRFACSPRDYRARLDA